MLALKGYYNGKDFLPLEKVNVKTNQKVIITLLDEYVIPEENTDKPYKKYIGKLDSISFNEINKALKDTEGVDTSEW